MIDDNFTPINAIGYFLGFNYLCTLILLYMEDNYFEIVRKKWIGSDYIFIPIIFLGIVGLLSVLAPLLLFAELNLKVSQRYSHENHVIWFNYIYVRKKFHVTLVRLLIGGILVVWMLMVYLGLKKDLQEIYSYTDSTTQQYYLDLELFEIAEMDDGTETRIKKNPCLIKQEW